MGAQPTDADQDKAPDHRPATGVPAAAEALPSSRCTRCGKAFEGDALRCAPCARAVGVEIEETLARYPGMVRLPTQNIPMFLLRSFLDDQDCDRLIDLIDADRMPSRLLAESSDPEFRTSESCNLKRDDSFVRRIEDKITKVFGIDPKYGETVQGQRYAVGQQFKPHHDFFHPNQPYTKEQEKLGGQRTWTAMIFLNEPEAGGQTFFPKANVRITPRRGNLFIWNNLDEDGDPNPYSLHQGMPVEAGVKYVITKWYREREWGIRLPAKPGPKVKVPVAPRAARNRS